MWRQFQSVPRTMTISPGKTSHFPQLEGLLDLACRDGVDIRPTLLRVLTDLFVQKRAHSAGEIAQFQELASHLVETADATTRAAVAIRLMTCPDAPRAVLDRLQELTGQELPMTHEPAPPLVPAARNDLTELFMNAGSEERRLILANLDTRDTPKALLTPEAALHCLELEKAALAHDTAAFAETLTRAFAIPGDLAARIAEDPMGEPILVAARALAMPAAMLQRILLLINPAIGQSVSRVYELANLYTEISPQSAAAMSQIWRGGVPASRATHQPIHHDDEKRSARAAASTSRFRTARRNDALAARFKATGR